MAGLRRTIHPAANVEFGSLERIVPDIDVQHVGNGDGEKPRALRFTDPDGETHIWLFTEEGRKLLIKQLTGGLIVPSG